MGATLWEATAGLLGPATLRIGVTGLARAGKTAFLTSVAANLLGLGAGLPTLPALTLRLAGRTLRVGVAPAGAGPVPRFDHAGHLACLGADPPRWPERTGAVSLLALDLEIGRAGLLAALPPRRLRLEFLDYPGEWLLDLALLGDAFSVWSRAALRRLERAPTAQAGEFLGFVQGLPVRAPADEALAAAGHRLYRATLQRLRDSAGLRFLQPGRFLMPAPGPEPPWMGFFPTATSGGLGELLTARYDAYRDAVRRDMADPLFGRVDRLVVLVDLLSALHEGAAAYADTAAALAAAAAGLRWQRSWLDAVPLLRDLPLPFWLTAGVRRVAFAATKADHVAERQRGNLAALARSLTRLPDEAAGAPVQACAVAAIRCTEDFVWTLEGRPVSAVRGRVLGDTRMTRSYPGEVPDRPPDATFWAHPFLALPEFEPMRLPGAGSGGVPQLGLDTLLAWLLDDML
ncbi:MAG: YcjX family protein [Acidisphaera sp.]|nr:YcjX family protein [Acidisphaera sp.]